MTFVLRKKETTTITSIKLTSILKFEILHFSDNIRKKIPMIQNLFSVQRKVYITYRILAINFRDYKFFRCEFGEQVLFHFLSQKKSPAKNLVFVQSVSVSQSVFFCFGGVLFLRRQPKLRPIDRWNLLAAAPEWYVYVIRQIIQRDFRKFLVCHNEWPLATKLLYCCLCTLTAFRLAQVVMTCSVSSKGRREGLLHLSLTFERALKPVV